MKKIFFILTLLGVALCRGAVMPVVIPEEAKEIEKFAAAELAEYLGKVLGEKVPVITEKQLVPEQKAYFVGDTERAAAEKIVQPRASNSFIIKYKDGSLFLNGVDGKGRENRDYTPAGTLFAVYHFLRANVGVRWLYPGKDGEFVPQRPGFVPDGSCDKIYLPKLMDRIQNKRLTAEVRRFYRRNMFLYRAYRTQGRGGHNVWIYREFGKSDPDIFAMDKHGARHAAPNATFCLSSPKLQEILVKDALKKKRHFVSGHEADNVFRCMCAGCTAWDGADLRGPTGRYSEFPNMGERYGRWYSELLAKGKKADPAMRVSAYAYQSFFYAPRQTKLTKDIHVGLVPDLPFPRMPEHNEFLKREYKAWYDSGASLYLRHNYFHGGYCMPEVWYDEYAAEFKLLCKYKIYGVVTDGMSDMWATRGLDQYVAIRLHAEPDADPEALAEEYFSGFGKAAPAVREYFKYFQKYMKDNRARINQLYETSFRKWYFHGFDYSLYAHKIFPAEVLKSQQPLLEKAAQLVQHDPASAKKVAFLQAGLTNAIASVECAKMFASKADAVKKAAKLRSLHLLRKTLPQYSYDPRYCRDLESRNWRIAIAPRLAGSCQALPEFFAVKADPADAGERAGWYKTDFDDSTWQQASTWKTLENSGFRNHMHMFYRTKFSISETDGNRCILRLGAVDKDCKVWVNGRIAGEHRFDGKKNPGMWAEAVEFDITDFCSIGKNNQLTVKVSSRGGAHSGIWKPSFIRMEKPAAGSAAIPEFKLNKDVSTEKVGEYACIVLTHNAKRPLQIIKGFCELPSLAAGTRVRVRGEVNISGLQSARVDVSLRQYRGKSHTRFTDIVYRTNTDRWEDFSFEAEIAPGTDNFFLALIGRSLPPKSQVMFRNMRIEMLQ